MKRTRGNDSSPCDLSPPTRRTTCPTGSNSFLKDGPLRGLTVGLVE